MIADLLARSHASHKQAQVCRKAKDRAGHLRCISAALDLRLEAHLSDPDHLDPAWAAETTKKFHHDQVLQFYEHELGISDAAPAPLTLEEIAGRVGVPKGTQLEETEAFKTLCRESGISLTPES